MNFTTRLIIVIILTVALAEVAPDLVNAILSLILIGIVLSHWKAFSALFSVAATLGSEKK